MRICPAEVFCDISVSGGLKGGGDEGNYPLSSKKKITKCFWAQTKGIEVFRTFRYFFSLNQICGRGGDTVFISIISLFRLFFVSFLARVLRFCDFRWGEPFSFFWLARHLPTLFSGVSQYTLRPSVFQHLFSTGSSIFRNFTFKMCINLQDCNLHLYKIEFLVFFRTFYSTLLVLFPGSILGLFMV